MSKKIHEFPEEEITAAVSQLPIYIGQWMREVGIRQESINDGEDDIYESVKKTIMKQWEKRRKLYGDNDG